MASKLTDPNIQVGVVPSKSLDLCPSEIAVPGKRAPLDLTLKTTLQFVSSSSVKWWVFYSFLPFQLVSWMTYPSQSNSCLFA